MAINVAGTNALGDYLVSKIANTRTLMGLAPLAQATPLASSTPNATPVTPAAPSRPDYRAQVQAQKVINAQTLFGMPSATGANAASLPSISSQTPQQIGFAAIQSSYLSSRYTNVATLFGWIGTNTNTSA